MPTPQPAKDEPQTPRGQLFLGACPTAFETRNTGSTFEFEVVPVTAEDNTWDLSLAPEMVEMDGQDAWGPEELQILMPRFNSIRTSTVVRTRDNVWTLVSSQGPPSREDEREQSVKRVVFIKVHRAR